MAGAHDITIEQGATFQLSLLWKTGDPLALVNLTGYTARMQVREKHRSTTALLNLTTENGGITLGGAAGTIDIIATAAATAALVLTSPKVYVYDLEMISPGGIVYRLIEGSATITPEVTRA